MAGSAVRAQTCKPAESLLARLKDKPGAAVYNDIGVWFAGQQQYACAANAFATSLQMEPTQTDLPHVAFMFGVSLYFSGDTKEAIASLQEAEKLGYRDIKIHLVLATALESTHASADAETEWRAALALDPEDSTALDALSSDLNNDGDFNATIALLDNPRLVPQRTAKQSLNLGAAYAKTARLEDAARILEDGLNTSPDSIALADGLVDVLVQLHRNGEAATVLDVALAQHPEDPDSAVHYLKGLMAAAPENAPEAGHKLLSAFPQSAELLYLNGILEMKSGNLAPARRHLEQSLTLKPDEALTHEALGIVLAQMKELPGAKEHLERAIALGDSGPEVKQNLARVMESLAAEK
jgi:Flp pilus assembly protein TadD